VLILWHFGIAWVSVAYMILFSSLLIVTGTDLSHQIIPDVVTKPGIVLGLLTGMTVLPGGFVNSALGALAGWGLLRFLVWVSPYLFGKQGMGMGDVKLMAMVGAFLGWKPVLLTILIGSLVGSIVGGSLIALNRLSRREYIPFGPFLALGAVLSLFFHGPLLAWYWGLFDLTR
jgi:leader peptidase (prepilin peptidase)/N-methyltransferase